MILIHQAVLMSLWARTRPEIHVYETQCFTAAGIIHRLVKGSLLPIGGTVLWRAALALSIRGTMFQKSLSLGHMWSVHQQSTIFQSLTLQTQEEES